MSARLTRGGRRIDRSRKVAFTFDGRRMTGHPGDTLASALLANGQVLVGRSFKYHRPRGIVASGPEEPNALLGLGAGAAHEPNARATQEMLRDGQTVASQNRWPSLAFDVGAINARLSRFFPAGFYYKTFMWPQAFWKHVYEPVIRKAAGLGRPPEGPDPDTYEHFNAHCDLLIVGGGVAGLHAAALAGRAGLRVILAEQQPWFGGRAVVDGGTIEGRDAADWVEATLSDLRGMENVDLRPRAVVSGVYDHGFVTMAEKLDGPGPRERLWKIRARQVLVASGAIERLLAFANNDLPGIMLASAVRDHLENFAVSPGDRTVVVTNNDDAYRTALALHGAGLTVPVIVDARPAATGALPEAARAAGIRVETNRGLMKAEGRGRVRRVHLCAQAGEGASLEVVECDAVAMSGGWSPVVHLWSHAGGKLRWDEANAMFVPDADAAPIGADGAAIGATAGAANGDLHLAATLRSAHDAAAAVLKRLGKKPKGKNPEAPEADAPEEQPLRPVWQMPDAAPYDLQSKSFLDFQNDVKVSDVRLAAREGFESVEHAKRYTTLGMATDQGKLSNINGLAILSDALGQPIPQTGTTTFRPPYVPLTMGAVAGEARGPVFQPVRTTPLHDWHEANGADWEPVGHWRRPYCYLRPGEDREAAVHREVTNARARLGLLDASTLGKIVVKGPDAGAFLDLIYTGVMSTLKPGRCKYGLMCSDNGFLIDDGVVARLDDDTWLCHTTTGGADRIHAHMEEWLQTEWWDMRVWTQNLTEQYAQVAVVGPNGRRALEALGGMDLSKEALPFMAWAEGALAGIPARVFRISFSGELSYEVAVPAGRGRELWDRLLAVGADLGVMPYGTEALHVMRAEKGFIMIGDETDGTVIPQDLNLGWAISKKKPDYLGKRAQQRIDMTREDRWKLVGLETLDGGVLPDGAYAAGEGANENGQTRVQGRVTSTYHSPTLGRGIAMGLVRHGPDRMGEVLRFPGTDGRTHEARIVPPVFYDPEGERQDV